MPSLMSDDQLRARYLRGEKWARFVKRYRLDPIHTETAARYIADCAAEDIGELIADIEYLLIRTKPDLCEDHRIQKIGSRARELKALCIGSSATP